MSLRAKSKYERPAKPAANGGVVLYCLRDSLEGDWLRLMLAEKNVEGARIEWVNPKTPHPDLLVLNPELLLPTLTDRETVVFPASIIASYLDERYPHPPLLPQEPAGRALLRMALRTLETELFPLATRASYASGAEARALKKELAGRLSEASRLFPVRGWFLGLDFSLVDCAWAVVLLRAAKLAIPLSASAEGLRRYHQRLLERPSVRRLLA